MIDSKQCQRLVVQFLIAENVNTSEMYRRIQNMYGTEYMDGVYVTPIGNYVYGLKHALSINNFRMSKKNNILQT